jgi:hypothetical protein
MNDDDDHPSSVPPSAEVAAWADQLEAPTPAGVNPRGPGVWPCDHAVTAEQRRKSLRSTRPYGTTAADSPQLVTALAALLRLAGGVSCAVCTDLVMSFMALPASPPAPAPDDED